MRARDRDQWKLSCDGVEGIGLLDAYERRHHHLDGRDDELFPAHFIKVTISIALRGYKKYRRIKNVQRTRHGIALPVLRHRVVECVAEAVAVFLHQAETTSDHGGTFVFGPTSIQLRDLYLLELHRHGKTLVPVLGYVPPSPRLELGPPPDTGGFTLDWEIAFGFAQLQ
ncbi:uncharacterized protein PHACADRAFT_257378 [Phanerochaete carnosa HHB-10118-sp]|uniref:Uncharacterized protein n=1 Tax=Phanerochaete carnosa (strain HHB-10118-sp) TaxID=650164 RepID=K5VR11_PHACS|nr:uncharacterized protein PHACADRAFT_257378 [Phanerochaete carnosa HHB-10118-sp]EKM53893.1 hypothetical protein PHACADRAFT_257378 [Phanerochaete carnosa HHB-10118-sp]